jgi:hypothetical protein
VHALVVLLAGLVASQACNSVANGTLNTVADSGRKVIDLSLGLLLLALEVLPAASLLQVLLREY